MALPAWLDSRRHQNERSAQQERKRAVQVNGKRQAGSGSSWRARGDVKQEEFLEELKYTDKQRFSLDVRDWLLHKQRSLEVGREPKMVIDFEVTGVRLIITEESAKQ